MPVDNRTSHLNLPLPDPGNYLSDDVARMIASLNGIDSKFLALDTLLSSPDTALDTIIEIVNYIKANHTDIATLTSSKVDRTLFEARAGEPSGTTVLTYNGDGTINTVTEPLATGGNRVTTMAYNVDKTVHTVQEVTPLYTRTETYVYTGGKVTSITVVEA